MGCYEDLDGIWFALPNQLYWRYFSTGFGAQVVFAGSETDQTQPALDAMSDFYQYFLVFGGRV